MIEKIKNVLNENQLRMFRDTCFGYFLDLPKFVVQCQLIHSLLLRELHQPNQNEFWFEVWGKRVKYGIEEFALVTGLNCMGNVGASSVFIDENRLMSTYFPGSSKVNKQSVQECFLSKRWENDEDCIKLAVIFFVEVFLLSSGLGKTVSKRTFDIVESGTFNEYPWGKDVFYLTLDFMKGIVENKISGSFYRLNGFPYGFQVWFYEAACSGLSNICFHNPGQVPRILNWGCSLSPTYTSNLLRQQSYQSTRHSISVPNTNV